MHLLTSVFFFIDNFSGIVHTETRSRIRYFSEICIKSLSIGFFVVVLTVKMLLIKCETIWIRDIIELTQDKQGQTRDSQGQTRDSQGQNRDNQGQVAQLVKYRRPHVSHVWWLGEHVSTNRLRFHCTERMC